MGDWTGGLQHRGVLDGTTEVTAFAEALERVCVETVESGRMTEDLAMLVGPDQSWLTTEEFLAALDENLQKARASTIDPRGSLGRPDRRPPREASVGELG